MEQLTSMGFGDDAARQALQASDGNVETALNILLAGASSGEASGAGGEQIVRLGCSQYTFEVGSSACTPIACTLVTSILTSLRNNDASYLDSAVLTGGGGGGR